MKKDGDDAHPAGDPPNRRCCDDRFSTVKHPEPDVWRKNSLQDKPNRSKADAMGHAFVHGAALGMDIERVTCERCQPWRGFWREFAATPSSSLCPR